MKKIYSLCVLTLVALGALMWLINYLSSGTIIIESDKNSTITLQKSSTDKPFTKIGLGSLVTTVKHGLYTATVKSGTQETVQFIDFNNGHKTLKYSLITSALKPLELVTYQNSQNFIAGSSQLLYLSATSNNLYRIDQGSLSTLNPSQQFRAIKWVNSSFGVGQDSSGHLYTINNDAISPLAVPFAYNDANVGFAVSPNREIYLSHGADVYSESQGGDFKKIYTSKNDELALAAGTNQVAIACEAQDTGDCARNAELAVISTAGKVNRAGSDGVATGQMEAFTWSPNGQYLTVPTDSGLVIYDSSLHQLATIPPLNNFYISNAKWLDNSTLFYGVNNQLWIYNLPNQRAETLANMPLANIINGLAVSDDRSYIYVSTQNSASGSNQAIRRVGLRNQKVDENILQLQNALPRTLNDCVINLVNFTPGTPTILINPFPDSNLSNQDYINEAQTQLQQDGFDLSKLQFKISPSL